MGLTLESDLSRGLPWSPEPPPTSLCERQDLSFRPIRDRLFLLLPPQLLFRITKKLTLNLRMGSASRQIGLESQLCPSIGYVSWGC